jgi:cob(I)alamin adenosyltransferase
MGNRLTKIYTRTGDEGTTGLGDGQRVPKNAARVNSYGTVDELNSYIGVVLTQNLPNVIRVGLTRIQHELFDLGGELCIPNYVIIDADSVKNIEDLLDMLNNELSPLKDFILPGGCAASAHMHVARTICRRAERELVTLMQQESINVVALQYLNRLSDLLFVAARYANFHQGINDVLWEAKQKRSPNTT